jgi:plasmid stabilization system protein ParE
MPDPYRAIISREASADLQALHRYIARDSTNNAAKMVERILTAIESLQIAPHRTVVERQSRKVKHPVRSVPVWPYVIYFRAVDEEHVIRILTIRHGARRRPRRFD